MEAVDLQEGEHRHQRRALVPIDEVLALGDTVGEDRRLKRQVRVLVVSVGAGTSDGTGEPVAIAQLVSLP
jgi:hypothetical protein